QSGEVLGDVSADNVKRQLARLGWYPALTDAATGPDGLDYHPFASVDISPVPAQEPAIPLNLRSKFTYRKIDLNNAVLECAGSLVDADFDAITNVFPAPQSARVSDLKKKYNDELENRIDRLAQLMSAFEIPKFEKVINNLTTVPVIP